MEVPPLSQLEKQLIDRTLPRTPEQKLIIGMEFIKQTYVLSPEIETSFSFNKNPKATPEQKQRQVEMHGIAIANSVAMAAKYVSFFKKSEEEFGCYTDYLKKLGHIHHYRLPTWFQKEHWEAGYTFMSNAVRRYIKLANNEAFVLKEIEEQTAIKVWELIVRFMIENLKSGWIYGEPKPPKEEHMDIFSDCFE